MGKLSLSDISDDFQDLNLEPVKLPQEIIHHIIASLDRTEDRRLLLALSRVNQICRAAAQSVLFERVTSATGSEFFSYQVRTLIQGSGGRPTTLAAPVSTIGTHPHRRPRSRSPLPPNNLARYIRHLTLQPSSFFPLSVCKWHHAENRWSEEVDIDGQTQKWLLAYRHNLDHLFRVVAPYLESIYLPIYTTYEKNIDEPARTAVISEVKSLLGRYNMPRLNSLVLEGVDYDQLKLFAVVKSGNALLEKAWQKLADVEDSSALSFDRDVFYSNLSRLRYFKLRTVFYYPVTIECDAITVQSGIGNNDSTLRHLDESNPYPPPHHEPFAWNDDGEEFKEDEMRPVPLMPYFRCVGTLSPFLSVTRLELFERRLEYGDFALHKTLSYLKRMQTLILKDVWVQHTYDSWFLIFRTIRRLKKLTTLRLNWLGYCSTGRCPRHRKLKLCAVHVEEDALEMIAMWEEFQNRRQELEFADEEDEDEEEERLDLNDVKMFCRRHETKPFENAIRMGDEDVQFTG